MPPRGRCAGRRRQQSRWHRRDRRAVGRRARAGEGAPSARQAGSRQRLSERFHGGARRGLRRRGVDGRRLLARPVGDPARCWPASTPAPMPSSDRGTSTAVAPPTGRCTAVCCRGGATATPGSCSGVGVHDSTSGFRAYRTAALRAIDPARPLPRDMRSSPSWCAGWWAGLRCTRGADRVPRPSVRHLEDVDAHHRRVDAARDRAGACRRAPPPSRPHSMTRAPRRMGRHASLAACRRRDRGGPARCSSRAGRAGPRRWYPGARPGDDRVPRPRRGRLAHAAHRAARVASGCSPTKAAIPDRSASTCWPPRTGCSGASAWALLVGAIVLNVLAIGAVAVDRRAAGWHVAHGRGRWPARVR